MSIDYSKLSEVFKRSINENGTFKKDLEELKDCLEETHKKYCDIHECEESVFSSCAKLISDLTVEGIPLELDEEFFCITSSGSVKGWLSPFKGRNPKYIEDHPIPEEIITGFLKMIVRLIGEAIYAAQSGSDYDSLQNAIECLLCNSVNEFPDYYDGSIDYCIEYRDKVRKFLENRKKPDNKIPTLNNNITEAASSATDKLSDASESLNHEVINTIFAIKQEQEALRSLFECFANEMRVRLANIEAYQAKERRK